MNRVVTDELHVFLISKGASRSPITPHSVEGVHISRVHVPGQNRCTFSPSGTKLTEVEGHVVYIAHLGKLFQL